MTKLEELIKELCPNGVEYKKLADIAIMQRGTAITKSNIIEGNIPVIAGGKTPAYYCNTFNRDGETITISGSGAYAGYLSFWDIPIFVSDAFSIKGKEGVSTKYLFYVLQNKQEEIYGKKKGGGVPHVHISDVEALQIPLPPLAAQREIVRVLDKFTLLSSELAARQKQYEFYRDMTAYKTFVFRLFGYQKTRCCQSVKILLKIFKKKYLHTIFLRWSLTVCRFF